MSLTVVCLLLATITTTVSSKNYSAVELNRLRITRLYENHLLTRPSMKNFSQTVVAIGLGIIEVAGINPQKQVITLNVNFELIWCDDFLRWNTSEQRCINRRNRSELFFTAYEIWTPDIVALNGPGKSGIDFKLQYPVLAICTGSVRWSYQAKLISFCEIDVRSFPFDRQSCSILLQSSIYDASQLTLRSLYKVVRLYNFINTEWEIRHATIEELDLYNPHYARNFSTIRIDLVLVRFSRFYVLKIIVPFFIISSLALFSFWLPTDSGEKITLTVSVLLSLTIYLQIISDYVPKTERGLCILTLYAHVIFSFVFLSCLFNILTVFIYYREQHSADKSTAKRSSLLTIHQSLMLSNAQRRRCSRAESVGGEDGAALEMLDDIRYLRQLLSNARRRDEPLGSFDQQPSVKRLSVLLDRILFFFYLVSMPMCFVILFRSQHQTPLSAATNQLLDLRKVAVDPVPLYRGCPT